MTLIKNQAFTHSMTDVEKNACGAFVSVGRNFLGDRKLEDYKELVESLLENFHVLSCNLSIKMHFLNSHLEMFLAKKSWNIGIKIAGIFT